MRASGAADEVLGLELPFDFVFCAILLLLMTASTAGREKSTSPMEPMDLTLSYLTRYLWCLNLGDSISLVFSASLLSSSKENWP